MRRPVATYGLALAAVAVTGVVRWLQDSTLGTEMPFFTFYFAVLVSAWYGGFGPGTLSLALGILTGVFFFSEPRFSLEIRDVVHQLHIVRFAAVGVCISLICESLHRQTRRAEEQSGLVRVTLASIGDAVVTTDTDGRITFLNAVAESVTGWTHREASGLPLDAVFRIVDEDTRQPVENPATRALRDGIAVGLANHTVLIRKDGSELPIDDSAAPITDEHGRTSGCVLVFRDGSELRQTEKRIYGLMIELKEADRRKDEFLATLAHELRNPLAPLRSTLEIMKRADGDDHLLRQARGTMERQLGQMVRLVDDLIEVSRINQDKLELRPAHVELASVVYQAVEACQPLAEQASHELRVVLPAEPVYLRADPVRLAQVFSNLLSNSCKFTPPGGKIWVVAEREGPDAVAVTVGDTGTGIPADKLDRIFDMFTQVDRSLEWAQGGLGIGLTLVKRLVEMHGGSVEARSEGAGKGSEFVVRLSVLSERPGEVTPAPAAAQEPTRGRGRRILIVDDNRDSAISLALLLKLGGHETHTAHDGMAALEAVETLRPEVVLLDIGLPKLNGYEVSRRVREQPWGRDVLLIALTGWGQDEDRQKSQQAGFDGHLVKPVDHAALTELLSSDGGTRTAKGSG